MRLYNTEGATQVDDPEFGTFTADANGAIDGLPDAMYAKLHGRPGWENDAERELRTAKEELDRFRDPAELLKAVKEMGANQSALAVALASALGLGKSPDTSAPAPPAAADPAPPVVTESHAPARVDVPPVKIEPESPAAEPKSRSRGKATASK